MVTGASDLAVTVADTILVDCDMTRKFKKSGHKRSHVRQDVFQLMSHEEHDEEMRSVRLLLLPACFL